MTGESWRWLTTRCRRLFQRRRQEAELTAELQFHLEQLVAEFQAQGLSEREARLAARREFGAADDYHEQMRDTWRPAALADGVRALRHGVRSLSRSPGFVVVAILTLALGIGANTSMFSVVNAVILKPFPYPGSEQLDLIYRTTTQDPKGMLAAADFLELRRSAPEYETIAGLAYGDVSLAAPGEPADSAPALRVTADFFATLGIAPQLGRTFRADEDAPGQHPVVVLSERCWRQRFASAPDILGREVRVDGETHTIIGVLPAAFNDWRHLGWVDVFRPLAWTPSEAAERQRPTVHAIGRRLPGRTSAEGHASVAAVGERVASTDPEQHAGATWRAVPIDELRLGDTVIAGAMLIALSGFVLLIACSNLANLLLARTISRAREYAVRAALGASRGQLLRPLLVEAFLLAMAGGAAALLVVLWSTDWFRVRSTADNGEQVQFALDWTVFGWALLLSWLTALAFALVPALYALRLDLNHTLKSGGRSALGGRGQQRLRHGLIVGQFALALVLLVGAGVLMQGLADLNQRRQGWDSTHLITGNFRLPPAKYPDTPSLDRWQQQLVERWTELPGVASASLSEHAPFLPWPAAQTFAVEADQASARGREPATLVNAVTPDYFRTVGTAVVAGRRFDARDHANAPRVFVINEALAAAAFPGQNPLGRRLALGTGAPEWGEIVGVARDVRSVAPDAATVPFQLYRPLAQAPAAALELAVRGRGDAAGLVHRIRKVITELDPDLPVRDLKPAEARIARVNYQLGVLRDMLASFAGLGLALAAMGIYGVIARLMAQRMGEFGLRLALGAQPSDISRLVLASGAKLALLGAAVGSVGAWGVVRLLGAIFPALPLRGGGILAVAVLLLVLVGLLACYLPARKAARINPVEALHFE